MDIPEAATGTEAAVVQPARELRISNISAVPGVDRAEEQWVQFSLRQRLLQSSYGFIFVPEGRPRALSSIMGQVKSPPHGVRFVHPIDGRWFYFDHD